MANYELMLIINPELSEEQRNSSLENLRNIIKDSEWTISKEDIWWEKKLAYQINKKDKGFYVLIDLDINWTKLIEMTKKINLDLNIYRHMFVKKDA